MQFKQPNYKEVAKLLGFFTHLGYIMVTPILITLILGGWLDSRCNTSPLFLIIGVVLGVGGSFRNLFVYMNKFGE